MRWFYVKQCLLFMLLSLIISQVSFAVTIDSAATLTHLPEQTVSGTVEPEAYGVSISVNMSAPVYLSTVPETTWSYTVTELQEGENVIRVVALADSGDPLSYAEVTIVRDTIPPDTSITSHPANPTNHKTGSFDFASSDPAAIFECSLDGAAYAACSSPREVDLSSAADGEHSFMVRGKDTAGNVDATPAQFRWTIDTAAPGAPAVTGTTPTLDTTPTWNWSPAAGGDGTYRYELDSSDFSSASTQTTSASFTPAEALSEGSHTLYVQGRDAAGNWSESGSFAIAVDITAPTAVVSGTPSQYTAQTGATLTVSGADVVAYRYKLGSAPFSSGETAVATGITLDALQQGAHAVSVIGRDSAGNWQPETSATVVQWTVDSAVPSVSAGGKRTVNAQFTQTATATDATLMTYAWSKQGGPGNISFGSPNALSTTVSADAEGSYTLRFTATDAAGNSAYSEFSLVWDTVAPDTGITAHPANPTNHKTASFDFTSPDPAAVFECSLDGAAYAACSSPREVDLSSAADGEHSFMVRGKDTAGNVDATPAQFRWTIDTAAPGAPAVTGTTPTLDTTPTWNWSPAAGGDGTYRYELDSSDFSSASTQTTSASFTPAEALSEGSHTLYVQGRDAAGNWSESGSFAIAVDITAPTAVVSGTPSQYTAQTGATLTVSGADVVAYRYKLGSAPFSSGETAVATGITLDALQQGAHAVSVIGRDSAGNWQPETSATVVQWTVDSAVPSVSAGGKRTVNAQFTQTATATDATLMTYAWSKQGGPGNISFGSPNALSTTVSADAEGSYTLRFTATDAAGNSAYSDVTMIWDVTAPGVDAGVDQTRNAAFIQSASVSDATALKYQWTKQSGPGTLTFNEPNASSTTISASSDGSYVVRLIATDAAGNSAYDEMTLVWDTTHPAVDSGADQIRNGLFSQSATISDATALRYQWTSQSGPGTITFGTPNATSTTISASADGNYILRIAATDAAGNSAYSEMALVWDTVSPTVNATASFVDSVHVDISFSETVIGADVPGNYLGDNGLTVSGAALLSGGTYRLATSLQAAGTPYTITVKSSITDRAGNMVGSGADSATFSRPPESNHAPSAPSLNAPANGIPNVNEVTTLSPVLKVDASTDDDGDPITYTFELSTASDFSTLTASASGIAASAGTASWSVPLPLIDNTAYYWRTLAHDGYRNSTYMPTGTFFVNTENDAPVGAELGAPADGAEVTSLTPRLTVSNAADADQDALSYQFAVASDSSFATVLAVSGDVASGDGGSTSWTVASGILDDNTQYFWHGRGIDQHGMAGEWVTGSFFINTANDAPTAPAPVSPANGSFNSNEVTTLTPALSCNNASDLDNDQLGYIFEISAVDTFSGPTTQTSPIIAEGSGSTSWTPAPLQDNTTWYWHAKAGDGSADGPWTATGTFFVNTANNAPATPTVQNPAGNSTVSSTAPTLDLNAAADADHDPLTYEFAVFSDPGLSPATQVAGATEQKTGWTVDPPLQNLKTYYWTARAKDIHNYYSPWTQPSEFFVDDDGINNAPEITITSPGSAEPPINAYSSSTLTVSWSAEDPDSNPTITLFYDTSDGGYDGTQIVTGITKSDPAFYPWDTSTLADGTYYIYAVITDESASASTSVYSTYAGPVLIDRTPPTAPVVSGATPTTNTKPMWSWQTAGGGAGSYRYKLDNINLVSGSTETGATNFTPAAALMQGNHTLYVEEKDQAGNWSAAGLFTISIDTTPPTVTGVTCNSPSGSYKAGSAIPINLTFSEPVSSTGLVLSLSSGGTISTGTLAQNSSYSGTYTVGAGESTSSLRLTSVTGTISDSAANATTNPVIPAGKNLDTSAELTIDTTAPLVSAGANKVTNALFTQGATASDSYPLSYAWSKQAGPGAITFGTPNSLTTAIAASSDGTYQLRFTATDRAGNSTSSDMTLIWDSVSPTVVTAASISGNGHYRAGSSINVTVSFSEQLNTAGLSITLNSGATLATGPLSSVQNFSGSYVVADGENSTTLAVTGITGKMVDAAGNVTNDPPLPEGQNISNGKTIVVDTAPPDTAFISTPANPSNERRGSFSFSSANGGDLFECSTDSAEFVPCTSPYGFDFSALSDGDHSFEARAVDLAGNRDASPAQYSWSIKTNAPIPILSEMPVSPTNATSASVKVGGTDVTVYKYRLDDGPYSDETPVAEGIELRALSEGEHTLRVIARDTAGNWQVEADAAMAGWTVDTTPPTFQDVSTLPHGSFTNKNELNIAGVVSDALGTPTLEIEVTSGGTLYADSIPVDQSGGYSYLLKEKLSQGTSELRLIARDRAGNHSVNARSITYDPNAPHLTITTPADNSTRGTDFLEVSGSVDESVATVAVQRLDCQQPSAQESAQVASITGMGFTATQFLLPGCNTILVTVTDLAGNQSSDKRSVTFDDKKPTLAVSAPGADLRTQVSVMDVQGSVSDELSALNVTVDVNSETFTPVVENGSFTQQVRFTQNMVYHIIVKATDAGGNEATVQRNVIYAKPSNGDINNDGRVDILDCLIALRISAGLLQQSDSDLLYGDVAPLVNGASVSDGVIDVGDAAVILKSITGLVTLH